MGKFINKMILLNLLYYGILWVTITNRFKKVGGRGAKIGNCIKKSLFVIENLLDFLNIRARQIFEINLFRIRI